MLGHCRPVPGEVSSIDMTEFLPNNWDRKTLQWHGRKWLYAIHCCNPSALWAVPTRFRFNVAHSCTLYSHFPDFDGLQSCPYHNCHLWIFMGPLWDSSIWKCCRIAMTAASHFTGWCILCKVHFRRNVTLRTKSKRLVPSVALGQRIQSYDVSNFPHLVGQYLE